MAGATELADSVGELMDSPGGRLLLDIKAHLRRRVRLLAAAFGLTFVAVSYTHLTLPTKRIV